MATLEELRAEQARRRQEREDAARSAQDGQPSVEALRAERQRRASQPGVLDKAEEFAEGGLETAGEIVNAPVHLWNMLKTLKATAPLIGSDKPVPVEEFAEPWFDVPKAVQSAYGEPDPRMPGVREAGGKWGGPVIAGAVTRNPLVGAALGAGSTLISEGAGQLGRLADYWAGNKSPRYQTFGETIGGLYAPTKGPLTSMRSRKKYTGPETEDVKGALKRNPDIPPSLPMLAGERAKRARLPQGQFSKILTGMENLRGKVEEGVRGGGRVIKPTKEQMSKETQQLADRAKETTGKAISEKQNVLREAAGGEYAIHDPDILEQTLEAKINDVRSSSREKEQAKEVRAEFRRNFSPKDTALDKTLRSQLNKATRPTDIRRLRKQINDNMGVNEEAMRKFNADVKARAQNPQDSLSGYNYKELSKGGEAVRQEAAEARGFPKERWEKTQEETHPLYVAEDILEKRGVDPNELKSDFEYYYGPSADVSPERLQTLAKEDPNTLASLLAAQYAMKTTAPGSVGRTVTPESLASGGRWQGGLGDEALNVRFGEQGTPLRQTAEDQALLARHMPGGGAVAPAAEPLRNLQTAASLGTAAATGNPIVLGGIPAVWEGIKKGERIATGTPDPVTSLMTTNAQDIASLLARSTVLPTVQTAGRDQETELRNMRAQRGRSGYR